MRVDVKQKDIRAQYDGIFNSQLDTRENWCKIPLPIQAFSALQARARALFSSFSFIFFFMNPALSVVDKRNARACCHYRARRQTRPTRIACETIETNRVRDERCSAASPVCIRLSLPGPFLLFFPLSFFSFFFYFWSMSVQRCASNCATYSSFCSLSFLFPLQHNGTAVVFSLCCARPAANCGLIG